MEVPYQEDLARRMLLPALFSAATGYVVFAAVHGTTPLFPVTGSPPFTYLDLGGAALLGLACGWRAGGFAVMLRQAKAISARGHPVLKIAGAGHVDRRAHRPRSPRHRRSRSSWARAIRPSHGRSSRQPRRLAIILGLFVLRAGDRDRRSGRSARRTVRAAGRPRSAARAQAAASLFGVADTSLFPVLGIAAFLGAGYRVPLAAVVFVAESTGRPGFVVPGLIAAASAQLMMGRTSVSTHRRARLAPGSWNNASDCPSPRSCALMPHDSAA